MPTGYTHAVQEGKVTEFPAFAMQCARAFGALIMMRDDPNDAPIPERFEPPDYHLKALEGLRTELVEVQALDESSCDLRAAAQAAEGEQKLAESKTEKREHQKRYEAMLAKVRAWTPPTPEHAGLKKFMDEQLTESIRFDCGSLDDETLHRIYHVERKTGAVWKAEKLADIQRDIAYHEKQHAEEVARANSRNEWLSALRKSLDC